MSFYTTILSCFVLAFLCVESTVAFVFQAPKHNSNRPVSVLPTMEHTWLLSATEGQSNTESTNDDWETAEPSATNAKVVSFLEKNYPTFYKLLWNDEMSKVLQEDSCHTIFVANEEAFQALEEKQIAQLKDPRNLEIRDKIASCHMLAGQAVSAVMLCTEDWTKGRPKDGSKPNTSIAAIVTLGGKVPVGRSKSGGLFGTIIGAKEDGDIVVGPSAKIIQSFKVEECVVHEMDALVSPLVLWRYMDQLRIPGF